MLRRQLWQFTSWEAFVRALHTRFGALAYDDPMEALTKLRQVSSVSTYKAQFEAVSNRIKELSEKHKLSCFLSGLKDEIRLPVKMFNPKTLNSAFGLAKIQEEYLLSNIRITKPWINVPKSSILGPPPTAIKNDGIDVKTTKFPVQKILAARIEERRKKGLCFHCEEKWHAGHHCKIPKKFLMEGLQELHSNEQLQGVVTEDSNGLDQGVEEGMAGLRGTGIEGTAELKSSVAEITLYALLGSPSPGTMRVLDKIKQ
ncbi:uncharacterized protein LOC142614597 [Castanea sativa]|uniref:uncharacterized protein LOC142614597 n=1 Tax=Castanea sativa TaxID=21020 RepID=UPI003F65123D